MDRATLPSALRSTSAQTVPHRLSRAQRVRFALTVQAVPSTAMLAFTAQKAPKAHSSAQLDFPAKLALSFHFRAPKATFAKKEPTAPSAAPTDTSAQEPLNRQRYARPEPSAGRLPPSQSRVLFRSTAGKGRVLRRPAKKGTIVQLALGIKFLALTDGSALRSHLLLNLALLDNTVSGTLRQ